MRFSGFDDEWNEVKLGDISTFLDNKRIPLKEDDRKQIKGEYPYYGASGIIDYVNDYIFDEELILMGEDGANIVTRSSKLIFLAKGKYWVNNHAHVIKADNNINQYFLSESLERINYEKYNTGTAQPKLNREVCQKIKVKIPQFNEQNKIANFLLVIDEKLRLLEQKYQYYQNFKKYLMQQIFTQKLRFDFNDEWRIRILNEITFYQEGPGVRNYQYTKEGVKLLNVGNFVNNALELDNTDKYISNEEAYGKYKHFLVDEGDLLIACSGIKAEYFDEKIAFAENKHLPLCMNTSTMRFKSLDENTLNLRYLKYYFQTQSFKKQVFQVMTGSAQFNFGPTHLKYFKIPIPCLDEQIKIYQMFESIDIKILNIYREIMKVKEFKKGLLQQMFIVRINWRCNFKLAKSPSFNKHLLILKNKIIFIIIE